jgi:hypothetical protein
MTTPWELSTASLVGVTVNTIHRSSFMSLNYEGTRGMVAWFPPAGGSDHTKSFSPTPGTRFHPWKINKITGTNPIKPSTIISAKLITKSAISNTIEQDIGENNFNSVSDIVMVSKYKNFSDYRQRMN